MKLILLLITGLLYAEQVNVDYDVSNFNNLTETEKMKIENSYYDSQEYTIKVMNNDIENVNMDTNKKTIIKAKNVFPPRINSALKVIKETYGEGVYNNVIKYLYNSKTRGFDVTMPDLENYVKIAYNIETGNSLQNVKLVD